jgi:hypothetical protein
MPEAPTGYQHAMGEQSSKHGPIQDSQLAHESRGMVQGGHRTHSEEWREQQFPGEGQPGAGADAPERRQGTPPGMAGADVELRAEIARFLGRDAFPGDREWLVQVAVRNQATDAVVDLLRRLPHDERFVNVQDVVTTLGLGHEAHRF